MRSFKFYPFALSIGASAAFFTGCGGSQSAFSPSATLHIGQPIFARGGAISYKVLFNFVRPRGRLPNGLTDLNGIFYGTTWSSGAYNLGTVFSVTTSGQERVLHSFKGTYGAHPDAGLTKLSGLLYGTTAYGGTGCGGLGCGAIFSLTQAGKERVLYSFKGAPDGDGPTAALTALKGTLYGTTMSGGSGCVGSSGCGTVFSVTTAGKERVLYSFKGAPDGDGPLAALTVLNGTLYGTTQFGGSGCGSGGCGAVFSITTAGKERVLYSFKGGPDGEVPSAALTAVNGTLYGTTLNGGIGCISSPGCGTVFSVTTAGSEQVLHRFKGIPDGLAPLAGLTALNGTLYGMTSDGGTGGCAGSAGCGTVFSVTTSGKERVLYSFKGAPDDGSFPDASPTVLNGILYGTTPFGGKYGGGTFFVLNP